MTERNGNAGGQRVPPYSEEAEMAAIGAMLMDCDRIMPLAIRMKLGPEAWYVPALRTITEAVWAVWEKRAGSVDAITVQARLQETGLLDGIGGGVMLGRCIDQAVVAAHGEHYLEIVREKWILRRVIKASLENEQRARTSEEPAATVVSKSSDAYREIIAQVVHDVPLVEVMDARIAEWRKAHEMREAGEQPKPGLPLPKDWRVLNDLTCGLEVGVTILAGRPSAGKTTMEDNISTFLAAYEGVPVGRITLDSTREELVGRMLARVGNVSLPKLKFGYARAGQIAATQAGRDELEGLPMWIEDQERDIAGIAARARHWAITKQIKLLTIDYIQLIGASCMGKSEWDTQRRVSYVSARLKQLAFELKIPVLVLSQLSRKGESDGDAEPDLTHLRDSGAIEQDADKVAVLQIDAKKREQMEEDRPGATKKKRPVVWWMLKHKNGEIGRCAMWLYPAYFRFEQAVQFDPQAGNQAFADDDLPGE